MAVRKTLSAAYAEFRAFDTSAPLYRAAAAAVRETSESQHANKSVWIVLPQELRTLDQLLRI
jgi:hypothetical protein